MLALGRSTQAGPRPQSTSPDWWNRTRAIYAAHALSGAGGPFLKFPSRDICELGSFERLPQMLEEAQRLGCRCLYLVDYWEGGYENKGDYVPRADLGGPEAFRRGIRAVHERGGRVLLYLEAFIVHRGSRVAREHGRDWAMLDTQGRPYGYYGRRQYYLMYPGPGSGWTDYLCGLAVRLTRDFGVDGFHLDSYGLQWDWKDYHPGHPRGTDPQQFNRGAVNLVKRLRQEIRRINPEAVVILEGCEHTELLEVCDGGQVDSAAWQESPLQVLERKPWFGRRPYKVFTAHFSLPVMEEALKRGCSLSLTPWWFRAPPSEKEIKSMQRPLDDSRDWSRRILTLWHWDNWLYANQAERPREVDLFELRRTLERQAHTHPEGPYGLPAYDQAVAAYVPRMRALLKQQNQRKALTTPADYLRRLLNAVSSAEESRSVQRDEDR